MTSEFKSTPIPEIEALYAAQKAHFRLVGRSSAHERIRKLKRLREAILRHQTQLQEGMWKDFHKPAAEVDLTEIYAVTNEIRYAIRHLSSWMRDKKVETPTPMLGSSSWIRYEPKGMALLIAPWNYPFQLMFAPLISAIAAGNTAILKPSEFTSHTAQVMKSIIESVFEKQEIAMVEGGVETSTALLKMKFDHIFFTGSPQVGKIVMEAAAKHLTSVTLELGGKSPTLIDESANLKAAVARITWAKFINAGQICIAPDYVLVHESKAKAFVQLLQQQVEKHYGTQPATSKDYVRMIHGRHCQRVAGYLQDSLDMGAQLAFGGEHNIGENYIAPTAVTEVPLDSPLMQEEIFGPILPILTYKDKESAVELIQSKEKPLALYIYSNKRRNIRYFLENTSAGGTCINNSAVHIGNPQLPFGGINNSGIGKSRGHYGFIEFSNERAILRQKLPSAIQFLSPPYTSFKQKLINLTIRWF